MSRRSACRVLGSVCAVICALSWAPAEASAERVTVGLYAPSAPFSGPSDRLQYVTRLAAHLQRAAGGAEVTGRVFARHSDFQAAVRRGAVQFAVLDAPYAAAASRPYRVLAATTRGGSATGAWHMVAGAGVRGLADVAGATVALPRTGLRELDFLCNVLLEGQVDRGYFASVTHTPDSFSAVTMVKLGRARAAFVPGGVTLPAGVRRILTLRDVAWPVLVALPGADGALAARFATAASGFGDGPLPGTAAASAADYRGLRAAYHRPTREPVMVSGQPGRSVVGGLLAGRGFAIAPPSVWDLLE